MGSIVSWLSLRIANISEKLEKLSEDVQGKVTDEIAIHTKSAKNLLTLEQDKTNKTILESINYRLQVDILKLEIFELIKNLVSKTPSDIM